MVPAFLGEGGTDGLNRAFQPPQRLYRRDLRIRQCQPEWMDDPALDVGLHHGALAGLRRVHWISGTCGALWGAMCGAVRRVGAGGELVRILDLASGGGDLALGVSERCQREGIRAVVHGCDISGAAVERARGLAAERRISGVEFFQRDVLQDDYPEAHYDVVMSSLFLHHLSPESIVRVLQRMRAAADLAVVDDLLRTVWGYWLACIGCQLLSRSPVVHFDGPVSVEAAMTLQEIRELALGAGMTGVQIRRRWPERFLLTWQTGGVGVAGSET
ncbi:MAG: hypothetical protein RL215_3463 [Planctomycetota bacterium]